MILEEKLIEQCRCHMTFIWSDLAIVTMTFKIWSWLYFKKCELKDVDTLQRYLLGVGVQHHGVS